MEKIPLDSIFDGRLALDALKNSSEGILIADPRNKDILFANESICIMLGYEEKDLLKLKVTDIHPSEYANTVLLMIESLLKGKLRSARHIPVKKSDGSIIYADINTSLINSGEKIHIAGFFSDSTETVKKEKEASDLSGYWEAVFNSIPYLAVIMDAENNILDYNERMRSLLKDGNKDICGMKCWEVFHSPKSSKPPFGCPFKHIFESKGIETTEIYMEVLGGYYLVSCMPVCNESGIIENVIHIAADITERKKLELELKDLIASHKETADTLEAVFNAIPDILGIQDIDQRVIRYNKAGYEFLNASSSDIDGKRCWELIGQDRPCEECATREVIATKKPAKVIKYLDKYGIWIDARSYPIFDAEGNIIRILEHIRDITGDKK